MKYRILKVGEVLRAGDVFLSSAMLDFIKTSDAGKELVGSHKNLLYRRPIKEAVKKSPVNWRNVARMMHNETQYESDRIYLRALARERKARNG